MSILPPLSTPGARCGISRSRDWKALDLKGSQQAMRDFSLPGFSCYPPLGIILPFAELAVAIALIPTASAWWGGIGALVLLLLFVAGIAYNLTIGRKPGLPLLRRVLFPLL